MADGGIEVFHQGPLLAEGQGLRPLQQFPLQQPGRVPHLGVGKAGELESAAGDEGEQPLKVIAGFLGVQVHVREVGVRGGVEGPAFLVVSPEPVLARQAAQQLAAQPQALGPGSCSQ